MRLNFLNLRSVLKLPASFYINAMPLRGIKVSLVFRCDNSIHFLDCRYENDSNLYVYKH
ncbi:hypothetical protein AHAS_Ahas04G0212000 [Arachis hypogaea]